MQYDFERIREATGLTQIELARRVDMAQNTLALFERGKLANATVRTVHKLAEAYGVPASDVFATIADRQSSQHAPQSAA